MKSLASEREIIAEDGLAYLKYSGQYDDGSDDSLASRSITEQYVVSGVGTLEKISPITLQVALKRVKDAQSFKFSRRWHIPRTTLHLFSGKLAVMNVTFLVDDDEFASEGLIVDRPILEHMNIDTKTLLKSNRAALDGIDCSALGNPTMEAQGGYVSRIMSARADTITTVDSDPTHLRIYDQFPYEI